METITIPKYILSTLTPDGYFKRWQDIVAASGFNYKEAYLQIEEEREAYTLPQGYSDYQSFKRCKHYHLQQRGLVLIR